MQTFPYDCPGFEMHDLLDSQDFASRAPKQDAEKRKQQALKELAPRLSESSDAMIQQLVEAAVKYCGADSAGISLEEPDGRGGLQFRWIAVAGTFEKYLHGTTPRKFSPCGTCLDRWRAQHYTVSKPFYDFLGVTAAPIFDGMLIPWECDSARGTLWAVSHNSEPVFDLNDYSILTELAYLVSVAVRHRKNTQSAQV
jgi:hypothetical protein